MDSSTLPAGKLPPALLAELLAAGPELPSDVLLGPSVGEDACAIRVAEGVLVAAADPITLTGDDVGSHAVVINANDVAVCGARPRWFLATVLLPEGTSVAAVRALFAGMREGLAEFGAALVGGHTEVTASVRQPVVSGHMLGVCAAEQLVRTSGARPGDTVVQVGPAPVEGAYVLAVEAAHRFEGPGAPPAAVLERARGALREPGISVVEPALRCAALGASALHDPTEGGLATGLAEVAQASGVGLEIDRDAVLWFEPGLELCRAVAADPWGTLASGALVATFPEDAASHALTALRADHHTAAPIGRVIAEQSVRYSDGVELPRFERDELSRVL